MSDCTLGNLSRESQYFFKRHLLNILIYWCNRKSLKVKTIGKLKPFDVKNASNVWNTTQCCNQILHISKFITQKDQFIVSISLYF